MTRLTSTDISDISAGLAAYDQALKQQTGKSVAGIAAQAWDRDIREIEGCIPGFHIHVVPVTAGQGIISDFSRTVASILSFLGFDAWVSPYTDSSGVAYAFEQQADAVMMADDHRFVGINLHTRKVCDNSVATGRVYAAILDLMGAGSGKEPVLVMGCGPVGIAGTEYLIQHQVPVVLYDVNTNRAIELKEKLDKEFPSPVVRVQKDPPPDDARIRFILEATTSCDSIPDGWIADQSVVAAPGVPLGVSESGQKKLVNRLIHDKLELGTAAMGVALVL